MLKNSYPNKMIEVEISGPVAKKEYEYLKKHLISAGDNVRVEKYACIKYVGEHTMSHLDVEVEAGENPRIIFRDHRIKKENILKLESAQFENAVDVCASLGFLKGNVYVREFLRADFGGAEFALADPISEDAFYYSAKILAPDPVSAKEAEKKLQILAKKYKLPIWSPLDMFGFIKKLNDRVIYVYNYNEQGRMHFKERFGI